MLYVGSRYDPFFLLYQDKTEVDPDWWQQTNIFNPYRVAITYELQSQCKEYPFKDLEVGKFVFGSTNPASSQYNDLADWYFQNYTLEIRIPWMLIGFMDPSKREVWSYLQPDAPSLVPLLSQQIRMQFVSVRNGVLQRYFPQLTYTPERWDSGIINYYARKKVSYDLVKQGLAQLRARRRPTCIPRGSCQSTVAICNSENNSSRSDEPACGTGCIVGVTFGAVAGTFLLVAGSGFGIYKYYKTVKSVDYLTHKMTQLKDTTSPRKPDRRMKQIIKSHSKYGPGSGKVAPQVVSP
jgi:hypothetical protein